MEMISNSSVSLIAICTETGHGVTGAIMVSDFGGTAFATKMA